MSDEMREKFWTAKHEEFLKLIRHGAVTVLPPDQARTVRMHKGHRIMGSRYVNTTSTDSSTGECKYKSRWCVLGHQDPDVLRLARENRTTSPTRCCTSPAMHPAGRPAPSMSSTVACRPCNGAACRR